MIDRLKRYMSKFVKTDYYEKQRNNLRYPNEEYINSESNRNKADLVRMTHVFKDNCEELKGKRTMLDVGCNDGFFMRNFDWPFEKYVGVDMFSLEEYIHSEDIYPYTKDGKITYITGIFEEIPLSEKFDFIFAGEIIEHVESVKKFLTMIEKYLETNGIVCFTTPNNVGIEQPEHYRQYSKETLKKVLSKYFYVIKIEELPAINTSWPFLYAKCSKKTRK